jgi:hypothetical protein
MTGRYGVLSILLFFIVLILGYENYAIWSSSTPLVAKKEGARRVEGKAEPPSGSASAEEPASREGVNVIAEKNIFNPERKEFSTQGAASMAKPVSRPQITLSGVVMAGDYQIATIINPGRPLYKGERETKTIKVGEMVGEYKLTKIMPDRIVMEGGEDSFEVLLYDPRSPKRRVEMRTPAVPATVTSPSQPVPTPTTPPPVVAPSPGAPTSPVPRSVTPIPMPRPVTPTPMPVPRASGAVPEGAYQAPGSPTSPTTPPSVPDPGLWRGRRPINPGGPPG